MSRDQCVAHWMPGIKSGYKILSMVWTSGTAFGTLLGMPSSLIRVAGLKSWVCSPFSLLLMRILGGQQVTQVEFEAPDFSLAQPRLLWSFEV